MPSRGRKTHHLCDWENGPCSSSSRCWRKAACLWLILWENTDDLLWRVYPLGHMGRACECKIVCAFLCASFLPTNIVLMALHRGTVCLWCHPDTCWFCMTIQTWKTQIPGLWVWLTYGPTVPQRLASIPLVCLFERGSPVALNPLSSNRLTLSFLPSCLTSLVL